MRGGRKKVCVEKKRIGILLTRTRPSEVDLYGWDGVA